MYRRFKMIKKFFLICALQFSLLATAYAQLPIHNPIPGGVAVVRLEIPSELDAVYFSNKRVLVMDYKSELYAVIGVPFAAAPGSYVLKVTTKDGRILSQRFFIKSLAKYSTWIHKLPNAFANLSLVSRLPENTTEINQELWQYKKQPKLNLVAPIKHQEIIPYAILVHKRFGNQRLNHPWLTYFSNSYESVVAPADGVIYNVIHTRYSGILVYINHGRGVASVLSHLAATTLKKGDKVIRGQPIGAPKPVLQKKYWRADWQLLMNGNLINPAVLKIR